jgi:hypothetical protein
LEDRYAVYSANFPSARRTDADETWFFSRAAAQEILASSDQFSSQRARLTRSLLERDEAELAAFYERWLMYSDGAAHKRRRVAVGEALLRAQSLDLAGLDVSWVAHLPDPFDLTKDYASPLVWHALPLMLAIPDSAVPLWKLCIPPLTALPGQQPLDEVSIYNAKDALQDLRRDVLKGAAGPLFDALREVLSSEQDSHLAVDLAINVVADGIHPTIAALAAEIWLRIRDDEQIPPSARTQCRFHEEAPFQYAARVATEPVQLDGVPINPGERVVACLGRTAESQPVGVRPLTFGHGVHACPGRGIAENVVLFGTHLLFTSFARPVRVLDGPVWKESIGYRMIEQLMLSRASAPYGTLPNNPPRR